MSWWHTLTNKPRGVFASLGAALKTQTACDHSSVRLREGTAEFEWFVARGELETTKNLPHGANHLANLLSYDPARKDWIELLERYLAAAQPDPEALIPRGDKLYVSTEAMRAYIWHKQGRLADAVDLLCQVTQANQGMRYLEAWALDWLEPAGAIESLPGDRAAFFSLGQSSQQAAKSTVGRVQAVKRIASLLDRYVPAFPAKAW